ncbi:MAG: winged helix-turn-helix domain-containing protein [Pikeienuella sp.]
MPVPDYQTLMLPVLRLLAEGRGSVKACLPDLVREFGITEEEAAELIPSGRVTLLANRAHWARTYMSKAGLLHSPRRNVHEATEAGRRLLAENPGRIDNQVLARFATFAQWKAESAAGRTGGTSDGPERGGPARAAVPAPPEHSQTPEEQIRAALDELTAALADDLLGRLLAQPPELFEPTLSRRPLSMCWWRWGMAAAATVPGGCSAAPEMVASTG